VDSEEQGTSIATTHRKNCCLNVKLFGDEIVTFSDPAPVHSLPQAIRKVETWSLQWVLAC